MQDRSDKLLEVALTYHQVGDVEKAEALYREILQSDPASAIAAGNLAAILLHRGQSNEASVLFEQALQTSPTDLKIKSNLAQALGEAGSLEKSMALYHDIARQTRQPQTPNDPAHKILHDQQQKTYLTHKGLPNSGEFIEQYERLTTPAIAARENTQQLKALWASNKPQHIVVDHVLSPAALQALQAYCLQAPIWQQSYSSGYLGAMPEHGLGSPLFAQIIEELHNAFRFAFQDHPLLYYWAFKYDSHKQGTGIHADSAIINANLWITPDSANKDKESGGLVLWDASPPADWPFDRYNNKNEDILKYLQQQKAEKITIPYQCNRMVIFDSSLFHKTDDFDFEEGYENRRINITLLFGRKK